MAELSTREKQLVEMALMIAIGQLDKKTNPEAIELREEMKTLFYSGKF